MAKIYIFGIGGTGSRVLRSLAMLLAAGVKFEADEIVPVIIDPDKANADLTRTVMLLNNYAKIRNCLTFDSTNPSRFFRTGIYQAMPNYLLQIKDTDDKTFKQFIAYPSMSKANKAMSRMLFSDANLNASMQVGFKGNPNIGSVVLNQIAHSADFQNFANEFSDGDRIFIISSIFGGTGASGFPLLLKTLRTAGANMPNNALINNAPIGAISVLPYFKLEKDDESEIDSSTFISKTKSALAYYGKNINGLVDAMYYIADNISKTYKNHAGGVAQQNDAHLIELMAATAIVDFCNTQFDHDATNGTVHKELGLKHTDGAVTFASFYDRLKDMLYRPLTQFTLTANALTCKLSEYRSKSFNANNDNFKNLYDSQFFCTLHEFLEKYKEWLTEMKDNIRPLHLFNLECGDKPFDVVTGVKPKKILSRLSDYSLLTDRLNSAVKDCKSKGPESKFMEMFYRATDKLITDKLSN